MESSTTRNNRIAKNTILLYLRLLITMTIGLYTYRIVLAALGVSDYGLYNVVGGFVIILSFLNVTMSNGTQRYLSFTLGEGNLAKLKSVFSNSLIIHISIAVISLILAETVGLWFVISKLNIPEGRETAAFFVYQFSIFTFVISVLQVPFISTIIAHERMNIYAYISIFDSVAKMCVAFVIPFATIDSLIFYSGLLCLVQFVDTLIYSIYCLKKYEECSLHIEYDKSTIREMTGFSAWTMIGSLGFTANSQGINVLLNIFFGTIVNAARGIAVQVNGAISSFASSFMMAVTPQIIKLYAENKVDEMEKLALRAGKFAAFLLILLTVPFFIDIEFVLKIWLGEYPEFTPTFVRIVLIETIIRFMASPVVTVTHAGGKLKMPNLTGGITIISAIPLSYVLLRLGAGAVSVFILNIFLYIGEAFFNSYYAQKYTGFSQKRFYIEVYGRVIPVLVFTLLFSYLATHTILFNSEWLTFFIDTAISVLIAMFFIFLVGMKKEEIIMVKGYLLKLKKRI